MISYLGDFKEDSTVYIMFNTFSSDDPSASCTITNFINTDVHIHKDDGLTQRNNAAGITVSVDFDGITGSHMVKIDTSDDTVAGFWVVGHEYFVRIEGTTIDGATINSVVGHFSIENRFNEVDVVKISGDSTAADNVELAFDGTGYGFTNCTVPTVTTLTGHTAQTGDSFARIGATGSSLTSLAAAATALTNATWTDAKAAFIDHSIATVDTNLDTLLTRITAARAGYLDNLSAGAVALAATALTDVTWTDAKAAFLDHSIATVDTVVDGIQTDLDNATDGLGALKALIDTVDGIVDAILLDTGTDGVLLAATATSAQLVSDNWDEILSGATHNISGSAGRRVREIGAFAIHSGTAQAGTSSSITLAATANGGDGVYNRNLIVLTDNTGVGQTRTIVDYDDTTKIVVIDRDWRITPDNTTAYQIVPDNTPLVVDHGVAQAGSTSTTIKLRAYASDINDNYLCNIVVIVAGTGRGQARLVGSYNGTTKVVTICGDNWVTTPDATSVYVMMPYGTTCTSCIGTDALALINAEVADVLTVDTIADSYVTDGNQPTIAQAILAIQQMMQEKSITGTTLTVKKPDGSTSAMTFTLDSETAPTSITRAT